MRISSSSSRCGSHLNTGHGARHPAVRTWFTKLEFSGDHLAHFGMSGIAIDDPHFAHANQCVEGEFFVRLIAGTVDLYNGIRTTIEILIAVDSKSFRREQHQIRNAVVIGPCARLRNINLMIDATAIRLGPMLAQPCFQFIFKILMIPIRTRRHVQHAFPHFIPLVGAGAATPFQNVFRHVGHYSFHLLDFARVVIPQFYSKPTYADSRVLTHYN